MADKTYALDFTLHDPKTGTDTVKSVTFTSPQGPQGVQGPTGPIGNSYGVYEKTFDTVADYKAFADTAFANGQAIVGGSVLDSGNYVTISILKYDGAQIWYAMPTNVDDDGTPAAWTVEVTPDANEGNLSNFKFYIFDPNYNEDISSYEDEMPPSLQTKVPYYASYAELPTDRETAFSDFGLADGLASNGRMVALFAFVGDELLLVEVEQSDPLVWSNLSEAKAIKQGQHVIVEYGAVPTPPADVFFIKDATSGESKDANVVYDYLGVYDGEVTTQKIADHAVSTAKLDDDAVTTQKVADYAITESKISASAVTSGKIADGAVTSGKLAGNAVTTAKISDGAVTSAKLASDAVTEAKIADGAVALSKLGSDAKEYIEERARFISLGDARFVKQSTVPKLRSYELSIAATALAGKFGLGSYVPQGTEYCLIYYGDDPSPMTLATISEGEGGNWVVKPSQTLASGTEVSCGELLYKITQGICKTGVWLTNIWDCVKPISCRFQYELAIPGTSGLLQSVTNADLRIKISSSTEQRFSLYIRNYYNSSISIDTSDYRPTDYAKKTFQFLLLDGNYGALTGLNMMAERNSQGNDCLSKYHINSRADMGLSKGLALNVVEYSSLNIGHTASDPACNYWFVTTDDSVYDETTNKTIRYDYKFEFSYNGMGSFAVSPVIIEHPAEATPTMAKVRAMSVQAEPPEPIMPRIPEGAVGIFSVDEHGNTINAMTREVIGE